MKRELTRIAVKCMAAFIVSTGLTAIAGSLTGITALASWVPGATPMAVNTAVAFVLVGVSIWLLTNHERR